MEQAEIQRIRGTNDVLPATRALQLATLDGLRLLFGRYGYEPIDTPVLEPTELFLKKSGEEIAARMYSFIHWNRNLCLRPEFTASVIRAYVSELQDRPLPVRLQYAGPAFRYEKPQRVRHRQFTEVGIECIGVGGPAGDAEVLAAARHGLETLGLDDARFVVGHLGAVLELLGQLGMEPRAQSLVLAVMEHVSREPSAAERIVARLAAMLGAGDEADVEDSAGLGELLRSFGEEGAARIAGELLERASLTLEGSGRAPQEIVERLLLKSRRPDPTPSLQRAIDFIGRLRAASGPPDEALPALRRLLAEYGLHDEPVREVEDALAHFDAYFESPAPMRVDLSLARGLRYYTGLVFEVYDDQDNQLAGGGRYDDLVRALGGRRSVPACGFSYGLERVLAALERGSQVARAAASVSVLAVPLAAEDYPAVAAASSRLRREGIGVELDLRFRGPTANLRHADRAGIPIVLFVGEKERAAGVAALRDMASRDEVRVPLAEVVAGVRSRLDGLGQVTARDRPLEPVAV